MPMRRRSHQHHVDVATARGLDELLTCFSFNNTGTDVADLQGNGPAASCSVLPTDINSGQQALRVQPMAQRLFADRESLSASRLLSSPIADG